jgi:hypothetical protein
VVTNKQQIAELKAALTSMGANLVYHDDKIDAHDREIEALLRVAQEHTVQMKLLDGRIAALVSATESLQRQWQAYLNTLPRQ